jgi:hypothetical protein
MILFGHYADTLLHRLCPYGLDIPSTIVVDDSGYLLRGPRYMFIARKPTKWLGQISSSSCGALFRPT